MYQLTWSGYPSYPGPPMLPRQPVCPGTPSSVRRKYKLDSQHISLLGQDSQHIQTCQYSLNNQRISGVSPTREKQCLQDSTRRDARNRPSSRTLADLQLLQQSPVWQTPPEVLHQHTTSIQPEYHRVSTTKKWVSQVYL